MNIVHYNPKTADRSKGFSLSAGSGLLWRTLPAFMVLVICFALASGWGIGVNKAYAETVEAWVSADEDDAEGGESGAASDARDGGAAASADGAGRSGA